MMHYEGNYKLKHCEVQCWKANDNIHLDGWLKTSYKV